MNNFNFIANAIRFTMLVEVVMILTISISQQRRSNSLRVPFSIFSQIQVVQEFVDIGKAVVLCVHVRRVVGPHACLSRSAALPTSHAAMRCL